MKIKKYLNENFPELKLEPPLFYNWETGIRFELGDPKEDNQQKYIDGAYQRATELFKATHDKNDEIMIVSYVDRMKIHPDKDKYKTKLFTRYIKDKKTKYKLQIEDLPFHSPEDDEKNEYFTRCFYVKCKTLDIDPFHLLKSYLHTDMARIYFINMNKNTIFHVYDDRGCDIIASNKESIRDIYENFNKWILDYDREQVEELFR
jgi:hypothetical protein